MLMYSGYRKTDIRDELVEDLGHRQYDFQDIFASSAFVHRMDNGGKFCFIDAPSLMEECLRKALL